jgi:hypothetical protein
VYNELFKWDLEKNEWFRVDSLNPPPPRCSHQCVVFRESLFLFGGEFCTADKFHHHRDLWKLDVPTMTWIEIKPPSSSGGSGGKSGSQSPSARSGHRMALWRNSIVLHGGFYEAFREVCESHVAVGDDGRRSKWWDRRRCLVRELSACGMVEALAGHHK